MIRKFLLAAFLVSSLSVPAISATPGISASLGDGAVIVGPNSNTCATGIQGAIRYTSTAGSLDYCNGSNWTSVGTGSVQLPTQATMTTCNSGNLGAMRINAATGGAAPAYATSTTQATSGGSVSLAKPSGVAAGDLLIMVISTDNVGSWTWPSGFTDVGSGLINDSGSTDGQTLGVAWKVASVSEPSTYATTISGGSLSFSAAMLRITGASPVSPVGSYDHSALYTGAATPVTITAPTITPDSDYNLVLWIVTGDASSTGNYSYTVPSGMTHRVGPNNNGVWSSLEVASLAQTTATATGALSGSVALSGATSLAYIAFSVAIKPPTTYVQFCDGSSWQTMH